MFHQRPQEWRGNFRIMPADYAKEEKIRGPEKSVRLIRPLVYLILAVWEPLILLSFIPQLRWVFFSIVKNVGIFPIYAHFQYTAHFFNIVNTFQLTVCKAVV